MRDPFARARSMHPTLKNSIRSRRDRSNADHRLGRRSSCRSWLRSDLDIEGWSHSRRKSRWQEERRRSRLLAAMQGCSWAWLAGWRLRLPRSTGNAARQYRAELCRIDVAAGNHAGDLPTTGAAGEGRRYPRGPGAFRDDVVALDHQSERRRNLLEGDDD